MGKKVDAILVDGKVAEEATNVIVETAIVAEVETPAAEGGEVAEKPVIPTPAEMLAALLASGDVTSDKALKAMAEITVLARRQNAETKRTAAELAKKAAEEAAKLAAEKDAADANIIRETLIAELTAGTFGTVDSLKRFVLTNFPSVIAPVKGAKTTITAEKEKIAAADGSKPTRTAPAEKRAFLLPLIESGLYTKAQLREMMNVEFPTDDPNENRILLTDSLRPELCRFEKLCVEVGGKGGIYTFAS